MACKVSPLERAFQLARSGRIAKVDEIRKQLRQEGYDESVVDGGTASLRGDHERLARRVLLHQTTPYQQARPPLDRQRRDLDLNGSTQLPLGRR